jgi:hypothetical protein
MLLSYDLSGHRPENIVVAGRLFSSLYFASLPEKKQNRESAVFLGRLIFVVTRLGYPVKHFLEHLQSNTVWGINSYEPEPISPDHQDNIPSIRDSLEGFPSRCPKVAAGMPNPSPTLCQKNTSFDQR